jgi:hypothetical protein
LDLIKIPTLHLHGTNDDNYKRGGDQLATYYHPNYANLLEIKYHHAMPFNRHHVDPFVAMVRALSKTDDIEDFRNAVPDRILENLLEIGPAKWRTADPAVIEKIKKDT